MHTGTVRFIPVLTSASGLSLTAKNWQEANINTGACMLASLLIKPGMDLLKNLPSLTRYMGWEGALVLNASMPAREAGGLYILRSQFDGSRINVTDDDITSLIHHLQPAFVIMPEGFPHHASLETLPLSVFPFFPVNDIQPGMSAREYGAYFYYDAKQTSPEALLQQVKPYQHIPRYVGGDMTVSLMKTLAEMGVEYLESDTPAIDAQSGTVYAKRASASILCDTHAMRFEAIDEPCACPTCQAQLTCAYLHHLFLHTPLLCQRFLMQHNAHYCQNLLLT